MYSPILPKFPTQPVGQPAPNPYDAMVQQRINAVRSQMEQEAMQSAQQEAALFDMLRQQASQMAPTPQLPQQAQFDPRMRDLATGLQFAGIFGNARPQFTQGAVQNVLQSGEQRKADQNQRYNLEAQQKGIQAQNEYQRNQRVGGVNAAEAQSQLEATMGRQKTAQGELSTLQKQLEEERTARRDQQFKVDLQGQKFEGQKGLERLKGSLRTTLAKLLTPAAKKQGLIEIMQPFLEQVRTGAMSKEDFQWLFADEYETLMSGDAKAAQAKRTLELLPEEKRLMGARATYYEKLPGILQDRMTVDQWKTMVGAELRMNEGLAAGPEGVKALEDAAQFILDSITDNRKQLTELRKEQTQLDPKDKDGIKAYAEAIAKKQNEIREGEAAYNQAKERVTDAKKPRPASPVFDPTTLPQFKGLQPGPPSLSGSTGK